MAAGIREVLAGQSAQFSYEYACHGPQQAAWFGMTVTRFGSGAGVRLVVSHADITERVLAEDTTALG